MRTKTLALLAVAVVSVGCSDTSPPPTASRARAASTPQSTDQPAIARAAEGFMRAILAGESELAAKLLTTKAAKRYAADPNVLPAMGMQVEQLSIGEVRLLNADEAAAQCFVVEPGAETAQELCCLLKREPAGWRVCGVAADSDDAAAAVISFEGDPPAEGPSQLVEQPTADSTVPRTASGADPGQVR